jgi:hypothetical protein
MSREEVVPQLAANMSAALKKVWNTVGASNPGDFDLVMNRIVELASAMSAQLDLRHWP